MNPNHEEKTDAMSERRSLKKGTAWPKTNEMIWRRKG